MSTPINIYLKMKEEHNRLNKELEIKDSTIDTLTKQITDEVAISAEAIVERERLRKALRDALKLMDNKFYGMAHKNIVEALGHE